jgi:hypothetical protein
LHRYAEGWRQAAVQKDRTIAKESKKSDGTILALAVRPRNTNIAAGKSPCSKDSALETLEFFGDAADYLLIENSARFKSDSFKATPLYDQCVARNSPTLVVPRISAGTLNAWEAVQHRLGEYLSLDKMQS